MVPLTPHNVLLPPVSGQTGRVLAALINSRKIPQALLLAGIEGIGKNALAKQLAQAINCEKRPRVQKDPEVLAHWCCGNCPSCRKIESHNHPDIFSIAPQRDQIRIDTIRTLITQLGFTPYIASYRFVLIRCAEKMTAAASNALLKILEEPPAQTHFILTTTNASHLLPTILSRCQVIRFQPWPDDVIVSHLKDQYHLDQSSAEMTVKLAAGSPIKAIEFAQKNWVKLQQWAIDALNQADRLSRRQQLCLAERLAQKKSDLETLLLWFKAVILEMAKKQSLEIEQQQSDRHVRKSLQRLIRRYEAIEKTLFFLSTNANKRMLLESMLLNIVSDPAASVVEES